MRAGVELGDEAPSLSSSEHRARNVTEDERLQMGDAATTHWHRQARKARKKTENTTPSITSFTHPSIPLLVDSAADAMASLTSVGNVIDMFYPSLKPGGLDR
ncbi:hypothetical protein PG997_003762 [Apiospora hydei]|uniref:Uncharacterized protein n=1 Tax=Apiospora hydei TaxID=1337664 RepID=A0ABR1X087_9PEZI